LLFIQTGVTETQRVGQRILHIEIPAGREKNAALFRMNQEFAGVKAEWQFQPQAHSPVGTRPTRLFGHVLAKSLVQSHQTRGIDFAHFDEMLGKQSAAQKFGECGLRQLVRVQISGLLHDAQALDRRRGGNNPADAQPRESDLRKTVNMNDDVGAVELL